MVLREALGGGVAEQNPEHAESDVQSPDFVTADGVSTKKTKVIKPHLAAGFS